jgi:FAD/FMN-containing dehydrogenase
MQEYLFRNITAEYEDYLRDESRKTGKADTISFPRSEKDIIDIMKQLRKGEKVTVQGARTGLTAGAVPDGGHIISLEKMDGILDLRYDEKLDCSILKVQPGALLTNIRKSVKKDCPDFFFPPDPTEITASIGGMVSCNASGARSFFYGPTRKYIEGLRIVMYDGSVIHLKRGVHKADGYRFRLQTDTGRIIKGEIPRYTMPRVKNASGYYAEKDMDLIDLFIGSEGTFGIISEAELRLIRKPRHTWGGLFFFGDEESALEFVKAVRGDNLPGGSGYGSGHESVHGSEHGSAPTPGHESVHGPEHGSAPTPGYESVHGSEHGSAPTPGHESVHGPGLATEHGSEVASECGSGHGPEHGTGLAPGYASVKIKPVAIEYFDGNSLDILRIQKETCSAFQSIPDIAKKYRAAIYVEFDDDSEEVLTESMIEASNRAVYCGGSEEDTWVAITQQQMDKLKTFRHAVPEAVNTLIDQRKKEHPGITKLGTDMAVPDEKLVEVIRMYKQDLADNNFESAMFGHIGNNHVHVNILPRNMEEYGRGKQLYAKWASKVVSMGGTVSAEHGIGKLKTDFLELMYGSDGINEMKALRDLFDPYRMINKGNLFKEQGDVL